MHAFASCQRELGTATDSAEQPMMLTALGNPVLAVASVVLTMKTADMGTHKRWRFQFIAAISSAGAAIIALLVFIAI